LRVVEVSDQIEDGIPAASATNPIGAIGFGSTQLVRTDVCRAQRHLCPASPVSSLNRDEDRA
jgi:hypothetical protein